MTDIKITKKVKPLLLRDQIVAAFPQLAENPDYLLGERFHFYSPAEEPGTVYLRLPDDFNPALVQPVIDAHDPTVRTQAEVLRKKIIDLAKTTDGVLLTDLTLAQTKALLAVLLWQAGLLDPNTMRVDIPTDPESFR